jgi:predicted enzyme related to lactoylglutathione lyase
MVERTGYLDGEPCWADVTAVDLAAAKHFYSALFGWTFTETDPEFGGYTMALRDGRIVAGISPPPRSSQYLPSAWSLYLASHDLEDIVRRVDRGGGKIAMGPLDIPDNGRMLFAFDPTGAAFGVWEPGRHTGSQLYDEPGALCWAEINTTEPATADAFYKSVFDYEQRQIGGGELFDYTAWSLGDGVAVCGRLKMTDVWDGSQPNWMVYFAVDDTDAAAGRVIAAGGHVQDGPFYSPHGRIAVVADPNGAVFSVISR